MRARGGGFTLVEMVVAIAIAGIVVAFAALFISAPVTAYETESRRAAVVDEAAAAWPAIQQDLERALPNSLRAKRNGAFVALELLRVEDAARYLAPPSGAFNVAGVFRGVVPIPFDQTDHYLSVNNCGPVPPACPDAYTLAGSMTPALTRIQIATGSTGGEQQLIVTPAAAFASDSPRKTIYLVSGAVTYLCDETQGTLRRFENYAIAASQVNRDDAGDFTAVPSKLMATGLTACDFRVSAPNATVPQTASLRLTATRNSGESITMFHTGGSGWLP
jgi:prepilin-type N-terminal cleavage/methylation domain-containing protein